MNFKIMNEQEERDEHFVVLMDTLSIKIIQGKAHAFQVSYHLIIIYLNKVFHYSS